MNEDVIAKANKKLSGFWIIGSKLDPLPIANFLELIDKKNFSNHDWPRVALWIIVIAGFVDFLAAI